MSSDYYDIDDIYRIYIHRFNTMSRGPWLTVMGRNGRSITELSGVHPGEAENLHRSLKIRLYVRPEAVTTTCHRRILDDGWLVQSGENGLYVKSIGSSRQLWRLCMALFDAEFDAIVAHHLLVNEFGERWWELENMMDIHKVRGHGK